MSQAITSLRVKALSFRHSAVLKKMSITVIVGAIGGSASSRFLEGILQQSGQSTTILHLRPDGVSLERLRILLEDIALLAKQDKTNVILQVTSAEDVLDIVASLPLKSLVILPDIDPSSGVFDLQPRHLIVPIESVPAESSVQPYQLISYGSDEAADAKIDDMKLYRRGAELSLTIDHQTKLELATHFTGQANLYALTAAVAAAYVEGGAIEDMQEGIADLESSVQGSFRYDVGEIYDMAFEKSTSPRAIELALISGELLAKRRLIVVFDQYPSDYLIDEAKKLADRVFVVTDEVAMFGVDTAKDTAEVAEKSTRVAKQGDLLLFIGSSLAEYTTHPNEQSIKDRIS